MCSSRLAGVFKYIFACILKSEQGFCLAFGYHPRHDFLFIGKFGVASYFLEQILRKPLTHPSTVTLFLTVENILGVELEPFESKPVSI